MESKPVDPEENNFLKSSSKRLRKRETEELTALVPIDMPSDQPVKEDKNYYIISKQKLDEYAS